MTEKPVKRYTVDGKPMTPDDLRRLDDYLVDIEAISIISDEMRIVVENEMAWTPPQAATETMIPRGTYFGRPIGERRRTKPSISSDARPAVVGSTAVISAKCSSMWAMIEEPCRHSVRQCEAVDAPLSAIDDRSALFLGRRPNEIDSSAELFSVSALAAYSYLSEDSRWHCWRHRHASPGSLI